MMKLFDWIVKAALTHRVVTLVVGASVLLYGTVITLNAPVDILPDLNRPTVTIFSEAEGFATEEVELLVSLPIESSMNGASGVERVRSISTPSLSLVFVEFDWNQDVYTARQIVSEKLQSVKLPEDVETTLGPISSIMGEIQLVGISSASGTTPETELRSTADWTIKPRLLTVPGVAAVTVIGGDIQEYQILIDPVKLASTRLSITDVEEQLEGIISNRSGGFVTTPEAEFGIRILGQEQDIDVIANTPIGEHEETKILLKDIANVTIGSQIAPRGDAGINGKPGTILSITKQPGANTLELTAEIDAALEEIAQNLDEDIVVHNDLFRQEKFIQNGINNVVGASRDAAILVVIILLLFLGNARAMAVTLIALPVSFVTAIVILRLLNIDINVMTLGGLAVAIGELTDDAVVGVENTVRWLKEKKGKQSVFDIVFKASVEVRGSVIFSTILVVLVFMPLFALSGIEGRLLAPLGVAYIIALIASTIVAMTVTTVLSYYLLPNSKLVTSGTETRLLKAIKRFAEPIIRKSIRAPKIGLGIAAIAIILTTALFGFAGKEFLPPFNEGTLTIGAALPPGSSLESSQSLAATIESALLGTEGVLSVARRTGRAEEDEHAAGVNSSEFEVDIDLEERDKGDIINDIKESFAETDLQGANITIGQPISHRIEHILSGVRAPLVIKVFGSDLDELQRVAQDIQVELEEIPGTLNPVVEQEVKIPVVHVEPYRDRIALYGFSFGEFTEELEVILAGDDLGKILDGNKSYNLTLQIDKNRLKSEEDIQSILMRTPIGTTVPLSQLADVQLKDGRSSISHDNGQRRIVISSGILDGDSVTIIETLKERIENNVNIPDGYFVSYEGTYKSQQESSRRLLFFSILALIGIIASLYYKFRSFSLVAQVLINVPVTYLGAMIAILLTGNVINLASLVGLISILGLATRNGILLIEHWIHLATEENQSFGEEMIVKGSLNRLSPMLMTSLTSMLALLPLMLSANEPGKEILYPLAVVTFGGLLASTIVEIVIRPGMFAKFGKKPIEKMLTSIK